MSFPFKVNNNGHHIDNRRTLKYYNFNLIWISLRSFQSYFDSPGNKYEIVWDLFLYVLIEVLRGSEDLRQPDPGDLLPHEHGPQQGENRRSDLGPGNSREKFN